MSSNQKTSTARGNMTIRLTAEERAKLDKLAAEMSAATGLDVSAAQVVRKLIAEAPINKGNK